MKKAVFIVLLFSLLLTIQSVFAYDGTCGTNVAYTISGNTISFSKNDFGSEAFWEDDCTTAISNNNSKIVNVTEKIKVINGSKMFQYLDVYEMHLANLDVSNVTDMSDMFAECRSEILDLSGWDTSSVTDMSDMFGSCYYLTSLDLSGWDTSSVTDMLGMFRNCHYLTSLDLSGWDTSNVIDMKYMFWNCESLEYLDLSGWDTYNVTAMGSMFEDCPNLTTLDISGWDTSSVTDMGSMFNGCSKLTSLDLSGWDTSNTRQMGYMFSGCSNLTSLDISDWDTSWVEQTGYMFSGCSNLTSLDLSGWDTSNVSWMDDMFSECPLETITLGEKTLKTNIFSSLPTYNSTWYYNAVGDSATIPLQINTSKSGDALFDAYNPVTMAGTWSTSKTGPLPALAYKITYKLNGGTNNSANPKTYDPSKTAVKLKDPTRAGYTFTGWYLNNKKITSIPKGTTGNITLTAKWSIKSFTITYKLNGGKNNAKNPASYKVTTPTFTLKAPTRAGFKFVGWYKNTNNKLTKITKVLEGSYGTMNLEARWKPKPDTAAAKKSLKFNATGWFIDDKKLIMHTALYDDTYFTSGKSTALQKGLAKISVLGGVAAYHQTHAVSLLQNCGFSAKWFGNPVTETDNDHVSAAVGIRKTGDTTIVAIWIKGTSANYEWVSNFNIGKKADTTGVHAGFNKAKNEIWDQISTYLKNQNVLNAKGNLKGNVKFWLTSHSRGSAVANLLAKDLSDTYGKDRVYAYTFAAPRASKKAKNTEKTYNNIINFLNPGDYVTELAPEAWGFYRFGRDITFTAGTKAAMAKTFKARTGKAYGGYTKDGKMSLNKAYLNYAGSGVKSYYSKRVLNGTIGPAPADFFMKGLGYILAGNEKGALAKGLANAIASTTNDPAAATVFGKMVVDGKVLDKFAHAHTPASYVYWVDAMYK